MRKRPLVYIAGPYSSNVEPNVHRAIDAAEVVSAQGLVPVIPHLNYFWHLDYPHDYEFWMDQDTQLLVRCEALLRLPGYSPGADREVELAQKLGIPVFYSFKELFRHFS